MMTGTWVNIAAILAGGLVGLLLKTRLPERYSIIIFQAIGLFTLFLGIQMAFHTEKLLLLICSLVVGSIFGEIINIEKRLYNLGEWLQKKTSRKKEQFTTGLLTAFLLFCMGSMTILGAFEEGLGQSSHLLFTKSLMDGLSSVILAATFGIGVIFSIIPLFFYQGGLTLLASELSTVLTETTISEISATGGILLIGLGLNILEIKKIPVSNMLPALVIAAFLSVWF
jgi:hypothetical protein